MTPQVVDLLSSDGPVPSLEPEDRHVPLTIDVLSDEEDDDHYNSKTARDLLDEAILVSSPPHPVDDVAAIHDMASMSSDSRSDDTLPDILGATSFSHGDCGLSDRTKALLASLDQPARTTAASSPPRKSQKRRKVNSHDGDLPNAQSVPRKNGAADEAFKESRRQEREAAKEIRAQKVLADKEQKRVQREAKVEEKRRAAEIAEVNKAKLDKKDTTPEMIVDLPVSLDGTSVDRQAREFLKNLSVDVTQYGSKVANVIKWRRKVKARWNESLQSWQPLGKTIIDDERHVLCLISADDLIPMVLQSAGPTSLEAHVDQVKRTQQDSVPIYMIEGLQTWLRKNKNAENRAYQARVTDTAENGASRRKGHVHVEIDEEALEDALMRLQVFHGCFVHHTNNALESAEWIATYTQHISTIPYRQLRMNLDTAVCMENGQVKTGEDKADTFIKMLQEIVRVTPSIAMGIAAEFATVTELIQGFHRHGPTMLEDLQKMANRNGAVTDRKVGPAISKRLHRIFTSLDPASLDV